MPAGSGMIAVLLVISAEDTSPGLGVLLST
jgi:hypothetical protein